MFEEYQTFDRIARRVSARLFADLEAGTIPTINIDRIRAALARDPEYPQTANATDKDGLEEMTVRRIVEAADA